jgi:hypothetical protein
MLWLSADTSSSGGGGSNVLLAFHQLVSLTFSPPLFFLPSLSINQAWTKTALKCKKKMPQKKKGNFFLPNFGNHTHTHTHTPRNNNNNNNPKKATSIIHMYNESKIKLSSCLEDICNFDEL